MKINQKIKNKMDYLKKNKLKLSDSDKIKRLKSIINDFKHFNNKNSIPPLLLADLTLDGFTFKNLINRDAQQLYIYRAGTYEPATTVLMENLLDRINPNFRQSRFKDIYRHIRASAKTLDTNSVGSYGYLIPCQNGVFNRKTMKLQPFSPKYFIKNKIATAYPNESELKKIKAIPVKNLIGRRKMPVNNHLLNENVSYFVAKFFDAISNRNDGTQRQLWQQILDSLEPNYNHGKAVINYGSTGSNGKSNFTSLITSIIGLDKVATVNLNRLSDRYAISTLSGKFANVSDDLGEITYLKDDANLKTLVTGGNILTEAKYQNPRVNHFKMVHIQNTNKLPVFQGKGNFIKRRLLVIPFKHQFKPGDPDYINNQVMLKILGSKPVREYVLKLTLNQPRFYYYYNTKASQKLLDLCIFKNDPVKIFYSYLKQNKVDRIPRKLLFSAWKSFASNNNFKSKNLSSTTFYDRFDTVTEYEYKPAKFNNQGQVDRVKKFLSDVDYHPVINDGTPETGHTYRSYVFN